jgi:hypothetical protein
MKPQVGWANYSVGIFLFDPFLPLPPPSMMCGHRNVVPPPLLGSNFDNSDNCGTHRALQLDFLDWIKNLNSYELCKQAMSFADGDELAMTNHLFEVAVANTVSFVREVRDAMEFIENRMHGFWRFRGYELDEETAADCIQMLRYFSMDATEYTISNLSLLKGRFRFKIKGVDMLDSFPHFLPLMIKS